MKKRPAYPDFEERENQYRSIFNSADDGLIIADMETGRVVEANPSACMLHGWTHAEFIGLLPADFIHPSHLDSFMDSLQAFRSGSMFDISLLHIRQDGTTFHADWRVSAITYQERLCLLGSVRDISQRIQMEQRLHQRVKARTREQATLLRISHTLASTLELQPELILDQLAGIINYTHAVLFGLTDSTLTALAVNGPQPLEKAAPFVIRLNGRETLAALFNGHQPIRIADVTSPDPAAVFLRSFLNGSSAVLLEGVKSWMWAPLAVKGRIIGGLGVAHTRRNYFTNHHAALILSMADQVAITMVNAELYEHARTLAVLQERQRLAQNLHDAVNQSLFTAGLIAEVLPRLWEQDPAQGRLSLEDLRRLTRGALAEMRAMLAELRPSALTDSSLADLLRQLANAFTGRTNVPVSLDIAGEQVLPAEIQVAFYRICQEAFNNIAKYAGASQVEVNIQYDTNTAKGPSSATQGVDLQENSVSSVEMTIRDDGQGFDTGALSVPGHYGLGMMQERAEAIGARLTITSQPGHGTEISLIWLAKPEQESL